MTASQEFHASCTCGQVKTKMDAEPRVRGVCHCGDCRELLSIPFHAVNAWEKERVQVTAGESELAEYQHPRLKMKKFYCRKCGDVIFNSNGMDWRVFSQHLIRRSYGGDLPAELQSKSHFFYGRRIIDVQDELPKRD